MINSEIQEINAIDLAKFNAIGYMGDKFSYVYSTHDGKLLYKTPLARDKKLNHVEQIFNDIEQAYKIANSKILIDIEEDFVIYDIKKTDFNANHPTLSRMEKHGCKIIKSAQYHDRFGFKIPINLNVKNSVRKNIYDDNNHKCVYCNQELSDNSFQIDHIVPKNEGGNNQYRNLALVCEDCNESKNNMIFSWLPSNACFKGREYLRILKNNYNFYKIKIDGNYRLVRKQKNFGFKEYFTIYKKINNIYVNIYNKDSGYQFIINIANLSDLKQITENGRTISNEIIEYILNTQKTNKCSTHTIDNWLI